jgi:hypothetical protein
MKVMKLKACVLALVAAACGSAKDSATSSVVNSPATQQNNVPSFVTLTGSDAATLYGVMEIAPSGDAVSLQKDGVNISCQAPQNLPSQQGEYSCRLGIESNSLGTVGTIVAEPTPGTADVVLTDAYDGNNLSLSFPYAEKHGIISLHDTEAKVMYQSLQVEEEVAVGHGTVRQAVRKQGAAYECVKTTWRDGSAVSYNCLFYIDFATGAIRSPGASI